MLVGMMLAFLQQKPTDHLPLRVLFLCTRNSARSQMAEALLRQLGHGTVEAYSAGSHPATRVHPLAVRLMERVGIDMQHAVPKHLEQFHAQHFDAIIIVCDQVHEICPVFPGNSDPIHWTFPDPIQTAGSEEERSRACEQTSLQLAFRVRLLLTMLERRRS